MSKSKKQYIVPRLILDSKMKAKDKDYYNNLHKKLPPMLENSLNISGIKLEKNSLGQIIVDVFVRSTLSKAVYIEEYPIVLLDRNKEVVARKTERFKGFGELSPNTAKLWKIEFSKENIKQYNFENLEKWSIAFEENLKHQLDLSDLNEDKISEDTKEFLNKIIKQQNVQKNELKLTGLSVKRNNSGQVNATLLISNGTTENLKIKQLPLKLYDANNDLVAKGTFKMENLIVQANTSKPISIVFPKSSILKKNMDLSKWSIEHHQ